MTSINDRGAERFRAPRQMNPLVIIGIAAFFVLFLLLLEMVDGTGTWFLAPQDPQGSHLLANTISRTSVALISTVFASLFLAIPLTASIHTPQLIDVFVRSWTNRIVLGLFVFSAGHSIWVTRLVTETKPIPPRSLGLSLLLVTLTLVLILPYLFSVFRFLNPSTIISHVTVRVIDSMRPDRAGSVRVRQQVLTGRIHHLGNIIHRALERSDRDVALAAVDGLRACVDHYLETKDGYPPEWFSVDRTNFPGLSKPAVDLIARDRTWVEMELLTQLSRAYNAALSRVPDVVSAISRILGGLAIRAAQTNDRGALDLSLRFFNNFIREAIKGKQTHAVFDILYQYRTLAVGLWADHPATVVRSAVQLVYYARLSFVLGMPFASDLMAYDLGAVIARIDDDPTEQSAGLLDAFLAIKGAEGGVLPEPTICARLILLGHLRLAGRDDAANKIEESLASVGSDRLESALKLLVSEEEEMFWEVTDRQQNLNFIPGRAKATLEGIGA